MFEGITGEISVAIHEASASEMHGVTTDYPKKFMEGFVKLSETRLSETRIPEDIFEDIRGIKNKVPGSSSQVIRAKILGATKENFLLLFLEKSFEKKIKRNP